MTDQSESKVQTVWLTSLDNPYNPFTRFDDWYNFDSLKGYNLCSYIARVAIVSPQMTEHERDKAFEEAIDRIMDLNPAAKVLYRKVTPDSQFEVS